MKTWSPALWFLLFLLAASPGCVSRYQITLNNNHLITTRGKPKFKPETGVYEYKNIKGELARVPAIRVKTIEPIYRFDPPKSAEPAYTP